MIIQFFKRKPPYLGSGKTAAGPWGDYNCDVPNRTIVHLFENLRNNSDQFDWVYWTGDITAHNIWNQTRTGTVWNGGEGGRGRLGVREEGRG